MLGLSGFCLDVVPLENPNPLPTSLHHGIVIPERVRSSLFPDEPLQGLRTLALTSHPIHCSVLGGPSNKELCTRDTPDALVGAEEGVSAEYFGNASSV